MTAQYPIKKIWCSRQQWQKIVEQFEQMDISASAFCRQHSLAYKSFLKWRTLFQNETSQTAVGFVEIVPKTSNEKQFRLVWGILTAGAVRAMLFDQAGFEAAGPIPRSV